MIITILKTLPVFFGGIASFICGYVMRYQIQKFGDGSSMMGIGGLFIIIGIVVLGFWFIDAIVALIKSNICSPIHWIGIIISGLSAFMLLLGVLITLGNIIFGIIFVVLYIAFSLLPHGIIIIFGDRNK